MGRSILKILTGIIPNKKGKVLDINGKPDHTHHFIGMDSSCCLSQLVRDIKNHTRIMLFQPFDQIFAMLFVKVMMEF